METTNQSVNSTLKQATEQSVLAQLTDLANETPTLLNDIYFIYLKDSDAYKQLNEVEKEDIDYLFCILNDSLFKLQGVS